MKINPIQISFKSNVEAGKPVQANSVATNPIEQTGKLPEVAPSYNVKVPLKYASLGVEDLPYSTKAHIYKLENGQKVVIVPKEGSTVVKTYVNSGSMNEPDKVRGISHFIEHNLFNGSEGLGPGEFFKTVNKLGARTNASTGFSNTDYFISSHLLKKNDLETEIKIHSSMLESPKFTLEMLEKEKGPVTSEINMILDDPENVAINNTIKLLYNIKSTSKDVIGGSVDNINKLTREDVIDYYQRNYTPQNMTTVITGEVNPEETIKLVSKYFSSKNTNPKPRNFESLKPIDKTVRNDIISDKTTATIVSLGFNGPKNNDTKGKIISDAIQFFLIGSSISRLNQSLQKIQTNAFLSTDRISTKPEDGRVILFSTQTSEANSESVIKTIFNEIASLENHPPTQEELDIVKKTLKLNAAQVFESSNMVNTTVGMGMQDNDMESIKIFEQTIDNLTSKDIVDFAKKYLDLNKTAITVIHPSTVDKSSITNNYKNANNISFTGNADELNHKEALDLSKIKKYGITNNLSVVTNDTKSDVAVFDMSLTTDAPANVKPGLGQILSIMLNRGSGSKDEKTFFNNLEKNGIMTGFSANESGIFTNSTFLPSDGPNAIKSIKEVILNPRFNQEELDYAKRILKESIQNAPKDAQEGLFKEMFKGQIYGTTSGDVMKSLDNIQVQDVIGLYKYIMNNASGTVSVSAPFEKNPNLKGEMFKELCTDLPTFRSTSPAIFNSYTPVVNKKVALEEHSKSQAEIITGYKFKNNGNLKDSLTFQCLNTILGGTPSSRLFSDLREKQKLAYRVSSQFSTFDNSGVLSLYIKTTTDDPLTGEIKYDNLQKSIDGFMFHTKKLMNEDVSEEELENAKLSLKNDILNQTELTADKNFSILRGMHSFYGVSKANQALDLIDKLTVADIRTAANYIFSTNPTTSVVATKNTLDNNSAYLKALQN